VILKGLRIVNVYRTNITLAVVFGFTLYIYKDSDIGVLKIPLTMPIDETIVSWWVFVVVVFGVWWMSSRFTALFLHFSSLHFSSLSICPVPPTLPFQDLNFKWTEKRTGQRPRRPSPPLFFFFFLHQVDRRQWIIATKTNLRGSNRYVFIGFSQKNRYFRYFVLSLNYLSLLWKEIDFWV